MSADNWAICPRCFEKAKKTADGEKAAVMASYGKVPVDEFDSARDALADPNPEEFRTFREDYEFYDAEEGTVRASYTGGCTECKLEVELQAEKTFWTATA